jgi:hypothetical protein
VIVAGFFGMIKGGELACPKAGNLCGLSGVFVTGPISFAVAAIILSVILGALFRQDTRV